MSPGLKSEKRVKHKVTGLEFINVQNVHTIHFVCANKYEVVIHLKINFTVNSNVKVLGKNAVNKYIAMRVAKVS